MSKLSGSFSVLGLTSTLQRLRAAIAVAEIGLELRVPQSDSRTMMHLARRFDFAWCTGVAPTLDLLTDHATPTTTIGEASRPLIFPRQAVARLRSKWDTRDLQASFSGLITTRRRATLNEWLEENRRVDLDSRWALRTAVLALKLGFRHDNAELTAIFDSRRGRKYPIKSWDDSYFNLMTRSQFVLCPPGDYEWTYRVFEAALCGALPVVAKHCECYGSLVTVSPSEFHGSAKWTPDLAQHNYELAAEMVTVPREDLLLAIHTHLDG